MNAGQFPYGLSPSITNLGGRLVTIAEMEEGLARFSCAPFLTYISNISCILQSNEDSHYDVQNTCCGLFLERDLLDSLNIYVELNNTTTVVPFHPGQFRMLIKLILRYCPNVAENEIDSSDMHFIGRVLLSLYETFNSLTSYEMPGTVPEDFIAASYLQFHLGYSQGYIINRIAPAKHYSLMRVLENESAHEQFVRMAGGTPTDVLKPFLVVNGYFGHLGLDLLKSTTQFGMNPDHQFGLTGVSQEAGESFLFENTISIDDARAMVAETSRFDIADAAIFYKHPFIRLPDGNLTCLDLRCAEMLIARGLTRKWLDLIRTREYFTNLPRALRDIGILGEYFQDYAVELIQGISANRAGTSTIGPLNEARREVDKIYVESTYAVVFEIKGSTIRSDALFEEDHTAWLEAINRNFLGGIGDGEPRSGISQLYFRCKQLLEDSSIYGCTEPSNILPVLVVDDETVSDHLVAMYLRIASTDWFRGLGPRVRLPYVIHGSDLRHLYALSYRISPIDALLRYDKDGPGRGQSFSRFLSDTFAGIELPEEDQVSRLGFEFLNRCYGEIEQAILENRFYKECSCGGEAAPLLTESSPYWICARCNLRWIMSDSEFSAYQLNIVTCIDKYRKRIR